MPIKRLKHSSEEELITHIKNNLVGHEEEYVPGSWEKFNKKEGSRPGVLYWIGRLSSAAAILLVCFGLFLYLTRTTEVNKSDVAIVNNSPSTASPDTETIEHKNSSAKTNRQVVQVGKSKIDRVPLDPTITAIQDLVVASEESFVATSNAQINPVSPRNDNFKQNNPIAVTTPDQTTESPKKPLTFEEFLAKENDLKTTGKDKPSKQAAPNKWDLGVVVAPSFGNNDKLNMGYGVSMAYNLNNKVSVGSGLSYNEMGASKQITGDNTPNSPSSNALVSESKSLQSVNTRVSGIDIPLEVRYNLSSRFYANVGVSAFAVINQQQNNVYLQGTVVQRSAANAAGDLQPQTFLVTEKVSEKSPETVAPNNKLIGFYNFSFGYKQKISKDKSIGIEPFMKVPMKDVTKENLRLLGTGLKIKFEF